MKRSSAGPPKCNNCGKPATVEVELTVTGLRQHKGAWMRDFDDERLNIKQKMCDGCSEANINVSTDITAKVSGKDRRV